VLEELHISGLGVIDEAVLPLGPGLTVVTGETGAGKTMVLQGLHLLAGGRADAGLIRPGAQRASVQGRLVLDPTGPAARRALESGAHLEDGELLISRVLHAEGRSRGYAGGQGVPMAVLAEIFTTELAVTGQSEQHELLKPTAQRAALDRFAGDGFEALLSDYRGCYDELSVVVAALTSLRERAADRSAEAELLRLRLDELEKVDPQPGEDAALLVELSRLEHGEALRAAAGQAHGALSVDGDSGLDGPDVGAMVAAARRAMAGVVAHDSALAALDDRLAELAILSSEIAADLASYQDGLDVDPGRIEQIQARRAELTGLLRGRHASVEELLGWSETAAQRLLTLDTEDDQGEVLAARETGLRDRLGVLAAELSSRRAAAADGFGAAVQAELQALSMPSARVQAQISQRPDDAGLMLPAPYKGPALACGPTGVDEVEIVLEPHPGAGQRPLQRGASGGELSRVLLAVQVVFADADLTPTLVFDEVDAGVGGKAAVEIGRRLARLARDHQVLCVTHLPQVAAFADRHLRVVKSSDGRVTSSDVEMLDDEGRIEELSRMLAGLEGSSAARAHVTELLDLAAGEAAAGARQPVG
jgi:DNA repair protein RecN (Recombination protein N)